MLFPFVIDTACDETHLSTIIYSRLCDMPKTFDISKPGDRKFPSRPVLANIYE